MLDQGPRRHDRTATRLLAIAACVALSACGTAAEPSVSPSGPSATSVPTIAPPASSPVVATPALSATAVPGPATNVWHQAAPMIHGRVGFDAAVLGDGTVLAVGDDHECFPGGAVEGSERAELYDSIANTWTEVESLNKPRKTPATVALADGSAFVIGGLNADDVAFSSTKRFDPARRDWADGPLLHVARATPAAAALVDGRVLVVSTVAADETNTRVSGEIYDPATGAWTAIAPHMGGSIEDLVPLADGRVLGVGAAFEISLWLEIFDPKRVTWTVVATPPSDYWGSEFVALDDGGVLAVGGYSEADGSLRPTDRVERYDPARDKWSAQAPMSTPRLGAQAVLLSDGRVLVAGGAARDDGTDGEALSSAEVFDPSANRWTAVGDLLEPRRDGLAVALDDGSVLVLGGDAAFNVHGDTPFCPPPLTSVERFYPGS